MKLETFKTLKPGDKFFFYDDSGDKIVQTITGISGGMVETEDHPGPMHYKAIQGVIRKKRRPTREEFNGWWREKLHAFFPVIPTSDRLRNETANFLGLK